MLSYQIALRSTVDTGEVREDRTGVGTRSLFGRQMYFGLHEGFPATTVKKLAWNQVKGELAAFLEGARDVKRFRELGCTIWDDNAVAPYWKFRKFDGDLGRIYGVQWRDWTSFDGIGLANLEGNLKSTDQIQMILDMLLKDRKSRRIMMTSYNPGELDQQCLPPCHVLFQMSCRGKNMEDLHGIVYMRSLDMVLGAPFDIASYALLMHLFCRSVERAGGAPLQPASLTFMVGDMHVYLNHQDQVATILAREPKTLPTLALAPECPGVNGFLPEHAHLIGYEPHESVKAKLNV